MRHPTRQQRLRHSLITEWRNADGEPLVDLPSVPIGQIIPQVLKIWRLDERLRAEEMQAAWSEIVGNFIAQHTAPDGIKRGMLTIRLTQPAIHHTLMMKKAELLQRLQQRFGARTIKDIRFRHG